MKVLEHQFTIPDGEDLRVDKFLAERKVQLLSAGLDEVPMAYKDIDEVMNAQADLVARWMLVG